jgi:carbamoyl-phosphate synthase large subunit
MSTEIKNILFCSAGRRAELIKNCKFSLQEQVRIIATDRSKYAPAIYFADNLYIVPSIDNPRYIETIINICKAEKIDAITTLIDPEIEVLAKNRQIFESINVEVLAPYLDAAEICFDKYKLFQHAIKYSIPTITTYDGLMSFEVAYRKKEIDFPVFVKPKIGSASVGAQIVENYEELEQLIEKDPSLIIQEFISGVDIDADVYIDTISKKPVRIFSKMKLETKIGGASKTKSFKDEKLVEFIQIITQSLSFNGPIDIDLFYCEGKYYLTEINPRFGGAYIHAFGTGVDFFRCIANNLHGIENSADYYSYEDDVVMMMYDSVVLKKEIELG